MRLRYPPPTGNKDLDLWAMTLMRQLGANLASVGTNNTIFGINAGGGGLCAGCEHNVFIGDYAGYSITSGDDNVGVGYKAGYSITVGNDNVLLGSQAGMAMAGGHRNIAIGNDAGLALTTGANDNVLIGQSTGRLLTTSGDNVGIGYQVFYSDTSGHHNVSVGHYSGRTQNGGIYNVYVGAFAGQLQTTGDYNVLIGAEASNAYGSYSNNVCVGYQAGHALTASNNILIGYKAGDNLTTGTPNLIIGYDLDASAVDVTNELNIGGVYKGDTSTLTALLAGSLTVTTIAAEATDVDKFLVSNAGLIKYRTGAEVLSDIGGGSGTVDTSGTPATNDFARFTDADTIEGRSYAEVRDDLDLEIGTDLISKATYDAHVHDGATLQHDGVSSDGGAFTFNTTGNVNFNNTLAISKSINASTTITISNTNAGALALAGFVLTTDGGSSYITRQSNAYGSGLADDFLIQEAGGGDIAFWTSAERMRIANAGNVGIGVAPYSGARLYALAPDAQSTIVYGLYAQTLSDGTDNYGVCGLAQGGGGTNNYGVRAGASNASGNNYPFYDEHGNYSDATAWHDVSDPKRKSGIRDVTEDDRKLFYRTLDNLHLKGYKLKAEEKEKNWKAPERFGLLANDPRLPDFLSTKGKDGIAAGHVATYLIGVIQHQKKLITGLEQRIIKLEM